MVGLFGSGFAIGYCISEIPKIDRAKVLNIVGLFYDLLGIVVLSEVFATNARWKKTSVEWIAPATLWAHTNIPLGAAVAASVVAFLHFPSAGIIFRFAFGFFVYSLIPLALLEITVVNPTLSIFKGVGSRWRYFGLWLLLSGVTLQLIAAVLDFK